MAFVLANISLPDVISVDRLSNDSEHIARVYIGSDDEIGAVYSVVVVLTSQPHLAAGTMELMFGITEAFPGRRDTEWINDGAATKRFLMGDDRKVVLSCVSTAACALAEVVRPDIINFVTAVAYLPDKALTKYGHICKAMRTVGYRGGHGDEYHGSHIWMLKRRNDET